MRRSVDVRSNLMKTANMIFQNRIIERERNGMLKSREKEKRFEREM